MVKHLYVTFKRNIKEYISNKNDENYGHTIITDKIEYMTKEIYGDYQINTYLNAGWSIDSQHTIETER